MAAKTRKSYKKYHKQAEVVDALVKIVGRLKPGNRLPRMRELADSLGVTVATLDQGLTQLENRGLIDRRPRSGVFVSARSAQKAVGLVLGWDVFARTDAIFFSILLDQCTQRAASHHERFSFFVDVPSLNRASSDSLVHQDLIDALAAGKLDGLLLASAHGAEQEKWLRNQGVPVVSLNFGDFPNSIALDVAALIRMSASELMKAGCSTIGFLGISEREADQFCKIAAEFGFRFEESWIEIYDRDTRRDPHLIFGERAAVRLMEQRGKSKARFAPQGIISVTDMMTRGACPYFASHGVKLGKELKIATQTNKGSLVLAEWDQALIQCETDPADVAEAMFSRLEALMDGQKLSESVSFVPPRLRLRKSE